MPMCCSLFLPSRRINHSSYVTCPFELVTFLRNGGVSSAARHMLGVEYQWALADNICQVSTGSEAHLKSFVKLMPLLSGAGIIW